MSLQPSDLDAGALLPTTAATTSSSSAANALRRIRSTGDIPPPRHSLTIAPEPRVSSAFDSPDGNLPTASASARNPTFGDCERPPLASPTPARTPMSSTSRRSRSPGPTLVTNNSQPRMGSRRTSTPRLTPTTPTATPTTVNRQQSWIKKVMLFFGVGRDASRERRTIVALFFALCSSCVQIIVISVILALSGTVLKSPTQSKTGLTEWVACERPLGVWACIWVFRSILASSLNYWSFLRERKVRQQRQADESTNINSMSTTATPTSATPLAPPHRARSTTTRGRQNPENETLARYSRSLPYTRLYSRLTLLSSLLTLSWFLTAHILEYTSINTCRHDAPHIWWLTFGILCLMYLSVLEVMVLSVVVFIVAPILFLFWNIILVCMGRHPLQTAGQIRHEIGKLPKSVVDRIPLVIYIPPPPEELAGLASGLKTPESAYSYPPKPLSPKITSPRTRFQFLRKFSSFRGNGSPGAKSKTGKGSGDLEKGLNSGEPQTWEEHWEKGEYPFVVLEGNRAACAICLMDFEEPKKVFEREGGAAASASAPAVVEASDEENVKQEKNSTGETHADDSAISVVPAVTAPALASTPALSNTATGDLTLADAGEGVQPLRLLECGHVFHKTCLDPWLTDISGRCPTCQRAVVLSDPKSKKTRPNRTERRHT